MTLAVPALVAVPATAATASPGSPGTPADGAAAERPGGLGPTVTVRRDGPGRVLPVFARHDGPAVLSVTASAPGVSWQRPGAESAVVTVSVDGRYVTDLVIPTDRPVAREFTVGRLGAGPHLVRLRFADDRSPLGATEARVSDVRLRTPSPGSTEALVQRHAPVVYGRGLSELGGPFQNSTTDTPLLAYHEVLPAATPGHRVLKYTVIWSNEDGGTNTPGLMARWGRTTDIEWAYQVEVDGRGDRVPGTAVYQAPNHQTLHYKGVFEGDRPRLETCTSNNNLCDTISNPMRFSLSPTQSLPGGEPREHLMDTNPWTYSVMAQEMLREGRLETPSNPDTGEVGDLRTYLYVAVTHTASPADQTGAVGLAVGVRLRGDDRLYTSHHGVPLGSLNRDGAAATTVELPAGTGPDDVTEIVALRSPIVETGAALSVTRVSRAFFLGEDYLPQPSFAEWTGEQVLTTARPQAVLWTRGN
ncbi:hypothetical protein AQ490_18090 [Wenjunlia vitaminophila]|uniref:Uncharacterized protein n=1 Tax=Wenjunlia vitaminophila TaxID=76728 RepID=A0A0T6LVG2_WENVI|nr:hypothetical protein AQ490_18090 [Wenjunlia vitaminophila]